MSLPGTSLPGTTGPVGIVLVNYNGLRFMPECLESLARIDYAEARIVLVDNASADGSVAWVRQHFPSVEIIALPTNTGITGGNNAGMSWCLAHDCDSILLLNNDTVVQPDFLTRLMQEAEPDCLLVPKIFFHDRPQTVNNHFGGFDYWRGLHRDWFYGKPDGDASREVCLGTMANTCALLIPRPAIERIGNMDERFFIYYDDTDFLTRAVRQGYRIKFVPTAVIHHKESSSSGGSLSPLVVYYTNRNRLFFMSKHQRNGAVLAFFLAYYFAGRVAWALIQLAQGRPRLIRALANAVWDFQRRRLGYAAPERFISD